MDLVERLAGRAIFKDLGPEELREVLTIGVEEEYATDQVIFEEGAAGRDLFLLLDGRVSIEVSLRGGASKAVMHSVQEDSVFGEVALVDSDTRSAGATATRQSRVLRFPAKPLMELLGRRPQMGFLVMQNLASILAKRIRKTTRELRASLRWG